MGGYVYSADDPPRIGHSMSASSLAKRRSYSGTSLSGLAPVSVPRSHGSAAALLSPAMILAPGKRHAHRASHSGTLGSPPLSAAASPLLRGAKTSSRKSPDATPKQTVRGNRSPPEGSSRPLGGRLRGAYGASGRVNSSPDLRVPLKLVPLPQPGTPGAAGSKSPTILQHLCSRPGSGNQNGIVTKSRRGQLWAAHSDESREKSERESTTVDEASWASATLMSLSPKLVLSAHSRSESSTAATSSRSNEPQLPAIDRQVSEARHGSDRRGSDTAIMDGGPTVDEALARLLSGSDGFPETELIRMNAVFSRHKAGDSSEANKEDLPKLFAQLGYFFANEDKVDALANEVSEFSTLDFQEFEHLAMKWCALEQKELRATYDKFEGSKSNQVPTAELEKMLRPLGVIALQPVVQDAFSLARLDGQSLLSFNEFLRFLAAYRALEGFTKEQLAAALQVFEKEASTSSVAPGCKVLKWKKQALANAMLQAYGEHIASQLPSLFECVHWDGTKSPDISFHEFIVWGRLLQDMELKQSQKLFASAQKDAQGLISVKELSKMMRPAGFTLFSKAVEEILSDMDAAWDTKFDFSGYIRFLKACQKRNGFTRLEHEELSTAFRSYDYDGSDGIDHLELLDLLRFLGYSTNLKDVHQYVHQVDFNGNGCMDFGEYLYLMRLHREDLLATTKRAYDDSKDEDGELHAVDLEEALEKLGPAPRPEVLEALLKEIGNPETVSEEHFVQVVDSFRRLSTAEKRKRAGFSDKEFNLICKLFEKHNLQKKQELEKGELILLLIDAGIFMNTADARNEVFTMLDQSREKAMKAGLLREEVGQLGSARCKFWPLVHLLRAVFHKDEVGAVHREDKAVDETRFEPTEVQEFHAVFLECCRWDQVGNGTEAEERADQHLAQATPPPTAAPRQRRASVPNIGNDMSRTLPAAQTFGEANRSSSSSGKPMRAEADSLDVSLKECLGGNTSGARATVKGIHVVMFSRRMSMRLGPSQREELERQVRKIAGARGAKDSAIDFADFLRLMKWMVDTNFANVNGVADKVVDKIKEASKEANKKKVAATVNVVSAAMRMSKAVALRRRSV